MNRFISFQNTINLKDDIQNRISPDIELRFKDALNNIKGDSGDGVDFSEVVKLAMAYFFSEIFKHPIKNQYYTLEYVKGFMDADNKTLYTEIYNVPKEFMRLENPSLFHSCWLIIQTAWFVNSEYFGKHQLIDYIDHYIHTGSKLPIDKYQFDQEYLNKKYADYDKGIFKGNTSTFVYGWFNSILFLICCELQLPLNGFKVTVHGDREYNPLTKCLRLLRPLMPFKVIENDIKSAFVSFIDIETGAHLKDIVYQSLMKSKGITRAEAKKLFNSVCNSGLKPYMTTEKLTDFFYSCGYSESQTKRIIQMVTDKEWTFFEAMTEYERQAIDRFNRLNNLQGTARIHDAVMYIDKGLRPANLQAFSTVFFGHTEMNEPVLNPAYSYGNNWLTYAHVSSIPRGLSIIHRREFDKPAIIGNANGFVFYDGKYEYYAASFNLNDYSLFNNGDGELFFNECRLMVSIIYALTERRLTDFENEMIVKHIRENSNHIFDKRYLLTILSDVERASFIEPKESDYGFTEQLVFKRSIDFVKAMNVAKSIVYTMRNFREGFDLLSERISNEDYSFLTESYLLRGRKSNNVLIRLIIRRWNLLTSGFVRLSKGTLKRNPLYNNTIKSVTDNCPPSKDALKKQKQRQRKAEALQVELIENIPKVRQLIFVIGQYAELTPEVDFERDEVLIEELKEELLEDYKKQLKEGIQGKSFDEVFPIKTEHNCLLQTEIKMGLPDLASLF